MSVWKDYHNQKSEKVRQQKAEPLILSLLEKRCHCSAKKKQRR